MILSYYNTKDPYYTQAQLILGQQNLVFTTGFISVLEFESVIDRLWRNNQIELKLNIEQKIQHLPTPIQAIILTETCFNRLSIVIIPVSSPEIFRFKGREFSIENTFTLAYKIGPQVQLRTLDNIQIASAVKIKQYSSYDVEYFLTNDKNILNKGAMIRNITDIIPISSEALIKLLKI